MTEIIFEKNVACIFTFTFVYVLHANMEEMGFITYTAAGHQREIKKLWLHL